MQRLDPLSVPWMVSQSDSCLTLSATENGDVQLLINVTDYERAFRTVTMNFSVWAGVCMRGPHEDWDVIGTGRFDDRLLVAAHAFGQAAFFRAWKDSGVCPDPGVYHVQASEWLPGFHQPGRYQHYIVRGHDAYAEVAANRMDWQFIK